MKSQANALGTELQLVILAKMSMVRRHRSKKALKMKINFYFSFYQGRRWSSGDLWVLKHFVNVV